MRSKRSKSPSFGIALKSKDSWYFINIAPVLLFPFKQDNHLAIHIRLVCYKRFLCVFWHRWYLILGIEVQGVDCWMSLHPFNFTFSKSWSDMCQEGIVALNSTFPPSVVSFLFSSDLIDQIERIKGLWRCYSISASWIVDKS